MPGGGGVLGGGGGIRLESLEREVKAVEEEGKGNSGLAEKKDDVDMGEGAKKEDVEGSGDVKREEQK